MIIRILFLCTLLTIAIACNKTCEPANPICTETPPTQELCAAYFERWFFDSKQNKCVKKSYSGCSAKGFETEQACNACKCTLN